MLGSGKKPRPMGGAAEVVKVAGGGWMVCQGAGWGPAATGAEVRRACGEEAMEGVEGIEVTAWETYPAPSMTS